MKDGKTKASLRLQSKGAAGDDDLRKNMLGPIPFMMFECRSPACHDDVSTLQETTRNQDFEATS